MEVYESIIVKVIVMLDEVEYDIIYNQKDKDLIYEDLSNIIKIAIDTKDFFKHIFIFGICIFILTNSDFSNILI